MLEIDGTVESDGVEDGRKVLVGAAVVDGDALGICDGHCEGGLFDIEQALVWIQ
jgi:hypothetical protein